MIAIPVGSTISRCLWHSNSAIRPESGAAGRLTSGRAIRGAIKLCSVELAGPIATQKFLQYTFFSQWNALHDYCRERGIRIMGDLPIYVAHDSVDVWVNPQYFQLDQNGNPTAVAGVPPDYFSATGQLWGNPVYAWDAIERDGYRWWVDRFRALLGLVDAIRMDHFRGFEAYWDVPATAKTAEAGQWVKGPGSKLFRALEGALGPLPLVAENLGVITPEVEAIRAEFGFPGMSILQFAFGTDPQASSFRPHNYSRGLVAYTGTHDCDTTVGWWTSTGRGESTRSDEDIRRERDYARRYLGKGRSWHGREPDPLGFHPFTACIGGGHGADPSSGRPRAGQRGANEPASDAHRELALAVQA